jgi:hypothetical protein
VLAAQEREKAALGHFRRGEFAEALDAYPECIEELNALVDAAQQEGAEQDEQSRIYLASVRHNLSGAFANYGSVLQDIADHVEAATQFHAGISPENIARERGIDVGRSLKHVEELRARLRSLFPDGFFAEAIRQTAASLLAHALDQAKSIQAWDFAAIQAHRLGLLHARLDQPDVAEKHLLEAIEYARRAGDHVRHWTARAWLADQALKRDDRAGALANLEDAAVEWMRDVIGRGHYVRPDAAVVSLSAAAFRSVDAGGDGSRAVILAESLKAATTASALATGFPIRPVDGDESDMAHLALDLHRSRESLRLQRIWSPDDLQIREKLVAVGEELSAVRAKLSLRNPVFAEWVDATGVKLSSPAAVRQQLTMIGPSTCYLGYIVSGETLWTYLLGQHECVIRSQALPNGPAPAEFEGLSISDLAELLLAPVASELCRLTPADRLIVSPDFGLFHVPFAALPLGGVPLCTRVTLSFVQGAGVLEAVLGRSRKQFRRVAAVGGPACPGWPDLPQARREATEVTTAFPGATPPLTGRKATVPALRNAITGADVLHIACHAGDPGETADQTALMLAPAITAGDSGILSEDRIVAELELTSGCLVNLAGCATATQRPGSGPLLGGLVPAFLVAGAGSVLASVRPIEDGEATELQIAFYRNLAGGLSPAESLAACQRACASGQMGDAMIDPRAWAYYVLYGLG